MINMTEDVSGAFRSDEALLSLLGGPYVWNLLTPIDRGDQFPRLTFFELTNLDNRYADDEAYASDIRFQVDVWGKFPQQAIYDAVDKVMKSLGFTRSGAHEDYEEDTKIVHKALRYKLEKTF